MGLTGIAQVRQHLVRLNLGESEVINQSVRLTSGESVYLPHSHIVLDSESVMAMENNSPTSEILTLGSAPVSLIHSEVISDSVVCASDSSLTIIYQENIDFTVDYKSGAIWRTGGSTIPENSNVWVWYLFYRVYQKDVDYQINCTQGSIRRLSSGSIEEGQEVQIDYRLGGTQFSEEEINQAITEAESEMAHLIHPNFQESTDPALQTAATSLALSILCRNAAGMAYSSAAYSAKMPDFWLELSGSYRRTAMNLLTWFRKGTPAIRRPRLA